MDEINNAFEIIEKGMQELINDLAKLKEDGKADSLKSQNHTGENDQATDQNLPK